MRSLGAICLVLWVAGSGEVHADPSAPQLSPIQGRREDAQRLREQLRDLDRRRPPVPVQAGASPGVTFDPPSRTATQTAGMVLLAVAGLSAAITFSLYELSPDSTSSDFGAYDTAKTIGLTTTAIAGVAGFGLVLGSSRTRVTPIATPKAAGLAISGRL